MKPKINCEKKLDNLSLSKPKLSGYKSTFTRNGQQIGESKRTSSKKTTLDFSVNTYGGTANWGVEVIVYVSEYDPFEQSGEDYEYSYPITGVFKVVDKTYLPEMEVEAIEVSEINEDLEEDPK